MKNEEVIKKIRKLLRVADPSRGGAEGEIRNAMALVEKLMKDNNLSMAQVKSTVEDGDIVECDGVTIKKSGAWHRVLAASIAAICEVGSMRSVLRCNQGVSFNFIGTQKDVDLCREVFQELLFDVNFNSKKFPDAKDRRSYCEGFAIAINVRALQIKKQREAEAERLKASPQSFSNQESTALVLAGSKQSAIDHFVEKQDYQRGRAPSFKGERTPAFYEGVSHGKSVNLTARRKIGAA